jgi:ssDNA-binding Zn-finger/Zn-ribbon topoisomerase 1
MEQVTCQCGFSFSFADGVKKKWAGGYMHWSVTCPECNAIEQVCKLSKETVNKRRVMIRKAKRYQEQPITKNKERYLAAVEKFQKSFDKDNAPVQV